MFLCFFSCFDIGVGVVADADVVAVLAIGLVYRAVGAASVFFVLCPPRIAGKQLCGSSGSCCCWPRQNSTKWQFSLESGHLPPCPYASFLLFSWSLTIFALGILLSLSCFHSGGQSSRGSKSPTGFPLESGWHSGEQRTPVRCSR